MELVDDVARHPRCSVASSSMHDQIDHQQLACVSGGQGPWKAIRNGVIASSVLVAPFLISSNRSSTQDRQLATLALSWGAGLGWMAHAVVRRKP